MLCCFDCLFWGALTSLCRFSGEGGKNGVTLVKAMVMSIEAVLRVQIPTLWERAWLGIIISYMMVAVAPAA
jgi:hypothetical protein